MVVAGVDPELAEEAFTAATAAAAAACWRIKLVRPAGTECASERGGLTQRYKKKILHFDLGYLF